ncbi:MAG: four helix bundle protein [Gemmatimonadales bacterium]|nr:four helix bundle protein [Gemmatimonadales bacterium]
MPRRRAIHAGMDASPDRSFRRLDAWRAARDLVAEVYRLSVAWPASERFGLTSQLRRAAVSVAANIAEGTARRGPRAWRQFLDIALGSLAEVECLLELVVTVGLAEEPQLAAAREACGRTARLTWALATSLRRAAGRAAPPA